MSDKNSVAFKKFKKEVQNCGLPQEIINKAIKILESNKGFCYYLLEVMKWPCKVIVNTAIEHEQYIVNGDLAETKTGPKVKQLGEE